MTTGSGTSTVATLSFTIRPAADFCPSSVCDDTLATAGTKTFYATYFDTATGTFTTAKTFSFSGIHFKGFSADGNGAQYTATKAAPPFTVETSTSAMVYAYVTTASAVPAPTTGHYLLPGNVASAAKVYGAVPYTSAANVSGCEDCHGAPYSKHGYRQAKVAGLNDLVSCKACHTDQRAGSDADWFIKADDPANYVSPPTAAQQTKYAYTANLMNDTHNTHAMEFNYPQSMANCVQCHSGKLASILTDANFKPTVCKSCHVVTGPVGGVERGRAPPLATIFANKGFTALHTMDLYAATAGGVDVDPAACNVCHKAGGAGKTFAQIHVGWNKSIFSDFSDSNATGTRYSDSIKVAVGATAWAAGTNLLTIPFTIAGTAANALVKPTVVVALYGYNSKDFVVSGHGSAADGTSLLEYTDGAVQRSNPNLSANSARLLLSPSSTTAGITSWTATADLTTWAAMISAGTVTGTVKRVQVNILPSVGLDQTKVIDEKEYNSPGTVNPNWNRAIAVAGASVAIEIPAGTINASPPGTGIVSAAKCLACHEALGTTFHGPNYGSAGVVACRVCHWVGAGGFHLELQSRSIDSYVHALHSMQKMDINTIDMTDKVQSLRYLEHIDGNYPNFAGPLNCESCHAAGKYDVPDQTKSLPSMISASSNFKVGARNIPNTIAGQITGPAERACGGCHRAQMINEDDVSTLSAFLQHTTFAGSSVPLTGNATTDANNLTALTAFIEGSLGVGPTSAPVTGGQVEGCVVCHKTAGSNHQVLFNTWKKGL